MMTENENNPSDRQVPVACEPTDRIASVDALRGLVILLMIFVNDVAGVKAAPSWLKHVSAQADAMTLPDVVFPAFLFIMGMSIPLALGRALARGTARIQLVPRILTRTLTLLTMGVFLVNMETHNPGYRGLWGLLAFSALYLAFAVVPSGPPRKRKAFQIARVMGILSLVVLALTYRAADGSHMILGPIWGQGDTVWLRHSWWGILGLIGWSYLVAAILYLILGHGREWLIAAMGMLALLYVACQQGLFVRVDSREWLTWAAPVIRFVEVLVKSVGAHVSIGQSFGSLASISMAGCCLGSLLSPDSCIQSHRERLRWALTFAVGLFLTALLFDPMFGINKIRATPAWCFLCASLTTVTWVVLYWIMDMCGFRGWSRILRPAGANPLTVYLLHPWLLMLAGFMHVPLTYYKGSALPVWGNILGCLTMAFAVVGFTGLISRLGYRMKA